jgi:hypothetical protein
MWQRQCPCCKRELRKASLQEVVSCVCNWTWGEEVKQENTAQLVDHFQVFLQEWAERNRKTIGEYYDTERGVAQQGL